MVSSELKQFGINSRLQTLRFKDLTLKERRFEFQQHLDSYVNEVIRDEPVSILFHYWLDPDNRLYLQPNLEEKNLAAKMFNPQERNGLYLEGFNQIEKLLIENPLKTVVWYSPIGKTDFDNNSDNPFSEINYDYGQFYIYFNNGKKIDAVALKTSKEAEEFFYQNLLLPHEENLSQEEKITKSILNPLMFNFDIESFLNWLEKFYPPNMPFYVNHHNKEYFSPQIIKEIRDRFAGIKKPYYETYDKTINEMMRKEVTEEIVKGVFQRTIYNYMHHNNLSSHVLAGSCGGSTVDLDDLPFGQENFLFLEFNPATTVSRLVTQGIKEIMKKNNEDSDEYGSLKFDCPVCNGEHTRPRHKLLEICPAKGKEIPKC
ncbi:MAG: hypothetical protein Q7U68_07795 [Candidatus Roizmanbacteria bacterium]|nr:hypothetical protein [Candidatus Roizmanbacteria bacterium]